MPSPSWKVLATRGLDALATVAEVQSVEAAPASLTVKLEPAPETALTRARRDPFASLTTLALMPSELALMLAAKAVNESEPPEPSVKLAELPASVMVSVEDPRDAEALAREGENAEADDARLLTTTT